VQTGTRDNSINWNDSERTVEVLEELRGLSKWLTVATFE